MSKKSVNKEFSKYSKQYNNYNIIQQIAAKAMIRDVKNKAKNILELGCGAGQVYKNIAWNFDSYTALDFSSSMCDLHPKNTKTIVKCLNFDENEFFSYLDDKHYDLVLSSSALQWSKDLGRIIQKLACITNELHAVLFTSNTFKHIQNISKKKSPILSEEKIKDAFSKYFSCEFETILYKLEFSSKKDLFNYIKKSGVSGETKLTFKEAKSLYKEYDLNYLEFEVIYIKAFKK